MTTETDRSIVGAREYAERAALADFPRVEPATNAKNRAWLTAYRDAGNSAAERRAARDKLIACNLPLVVKRARRFAGWGVEVADLAMWGVQGLFEAAERFDLGRPEAFSTYAVRWVDCLIRKAIKTTGTTIRIPNHQWEVMGKLRRGKAVKTRPKTDGGKARAAAAYKQAVVALHVVSLEARRPAGSSSPGPVREQIADHRDGPDVEAAEREWREGAKARVAAMLATLPEREAEVLRMRNGIGGGPEMTLKAVGEVLGLTRQRVQQLEEIALRRLRIAASPSEVA
jgi:RNA polymerase sigma factor (sigma-70 family)